MKRLLNPLTNPAGYTAFTAAFYAIIRAVTDKGGTAGTDPQVWLTAVMAVVSFVTRFYVTPVRDPKDGAGNPLLTHNQHAAAHLSEMMKAPLMPAEQATWSATPPPAQPPAGSAPASGPPLTSMPPAGNTP